MKKIIFLLSFSILSISVFAQSKKEKPKVKLPLPELYVIDQTGKTLAQINKDSVLVVNDSLGAIKKLFTGAYNSSMEAEYWKKNFAIAYEVIKYIQLDGTVSDRKKFSEAVNKFIEITGK